ncbi:MAG: acetyl-CoA carboxylase biotin carboxylase subunit [Bradymonadia bacterium]
MFRKVLVANRGEIALRIIHACHAVGAKAVAVHSTADADSPHLAEADETICIGPGPSVKSYLNQDALLQAALQTDCQAIHPGYGFLAENALFARRCEQQQLTFIGPSPRSIRMMGDKATARETMKAAGLPIMPGTDDLLDTPEEALAAAEDLGYPVLLKATAGGGGKGMRRVNAPDEMERLFRDAEREAGKSFGNPDLYMEKFIVGGRHIEFQILADRYGNVVHLGERECSIQRNHQKLIEEAPASRFDPEIRAELGERIREAVRATGYINAGTIEFLMDSSGALYFMEMNTRIQVEHPVTEMVTGVDLVAWQLRIAAGQKLTLKQDEISLTGHAIECRINAEDPSEGFRPAPGTITKFSAPTVEGAELRFDSHVIEGYKIPAFYDSMVGKLIVHAPDRASAVAAMREALAALDIEGVPTTIKMHQAIMASPGFRDGEYDCNYLPQNPHLLEGV